MWRCRLAQAQDVTAGLLEVVLQLVGAQIIALARANHDPTLANAFFVDSCVLFGNPGTDHRANQSTSGRSGPGAREGGRDGSGYN